MSWASLKIGRDLSACVVENVTDIQKGAFDKGIEEDNDLAAKRGDKKDP